MILYAIITDVSILKRFVGGIAPGIFLGIALMVVEYGISKKRGYRTETIAREAIPFVLVLVADLMVLTYVPERITFLPNLLFK
jgi:TRAP-type C4-dicarboxylate transport system permease large subunit